MLSRFTPGPAFAESLDRSDELRSFRSRFAIPAPLFNPPLAAPAVRPDRSDIISDVLNFPSDLYILQGCARLLGDRHRLRLAPTADGITILDGDLFPMIGSQTALR